MASDRLDSAVPAGETLRYRVARRGGGAVGFTDERLLVVDGEVTSVSFGNVDEVTARSVDWFVAVLSVALVGVGVLAAEGTPLVGAGFAVAGLVSLAVVYRKRGRVACAVHGRDKPLVFRLDDTEEFLDRLEVRLEDYKGRLAEERAEK